MSSSDSYSEEEDESLEDDDELDDELRDRLLAPALGGNAEADAGFCADLGGTVPFAPDFVVEAGVAGCFSVGFGIEERWPQARQTAPQRNR